MPRDWDAFYRQAALERAPAQVVRAYGPFAPKGPVLDLAGGLGRNALYFLDRGHPVVLVEKSREALRKLKGIRGLTLVELDLEDPKVPTHLPKGPFAAILMSYYVNRPLLNRHSAPLSLGLRILGWKPHPTYRCTTWATWAWWPASWIR